MSPSPTISPRLARQLAGRCCYGACPEPALDGSDYCAAHDAHEKGRDRAKKKRRRQRLADEGLCRDGCGRKVGKRKRRGRVVQRRCSTCAKRHAAKPGGVPGDVGGVPGSAVPSIKLELGRDGATRTRYVPRHGQGGPSKEETQRGHLRLIADARRLDAVFEAHYPSALPSIEAMPRIQRAEGRSLLASPLVRGARLRLQVAEEVDPSLRGTCGGCGRAHDGPDEE